MVFVYLYILLLVLFHCLPLQNTISVYFILFFLSNQTFLYKSHTFIEISLLGAGAVDEDVFRQSFIPSMSITVSLL